MTKPTKQIKAIPYGVSNFKELREEHHYYVDKTHFLPLVEQASKYLFFIRPRRMGKSLWLSLMAYYYDVAYKDQFENLFYESWILEHPTAERGSFFDITIGFFLCKSRDQCR